MFCEADFVSQLEAACPSAKLSLHSNTLPWCKKSTATLGAAGHLGASSVLVAQGPKQSAAVARPSSLYTECEMAFKAPNKCFDYEPFHQCCSQCGGADSYLTCHYSVDLPGGDHLQDQFEVPLDNEDCVTACRMLKNVEVSGDVCPGGNVWKQIHKCTNAGPQSLKNQLCQPGSTTKKNICPVTGADALPCSIASVETEMEVVGGESASATTVAGCVLSMMGVLALMAAMLRWRSPNSAKASLPLLSKEDAAAAGPTS